MGRKSSRSAGNKPPSWAQSLGAEVRRKRKLLRLSQAALAELAQCGPDFLYDLENGKPTVRLDKLISVLEVLGLGLRVEQRAGDQGVLIVDQPETKS